MKWIDANKHLPGKFDNNVLIYINPPMQMSEISFAEYYNGEWQGRLISGSNAADFITHWARVKPPKD